MLGASLAGEARSLPTPYPWFTNEFGQRLVRCYRLTLIFAVTALAAIAVSAFVVNSLASELAVANLVRGVEADAKADAFRLELAARDWIQHHGPDAIGESTSLASPEDKVVPLSLDYLSSPEGLSRVFQSDADRLRVDLAHLYDPDGKIVWSTDSNAVGLSNTNESLLELAAKGQTASEFKKDQRLVSHSGISDVVRAFVPLRSTPTGEIIGVLEINRDVGYLLNGAEAGQTRATIFWTTVGTLTGLFVLLVGFIVTADIFILRSKRRQREEAEKAQLNLESRVRERTKELESANRALIEAKDQLLLQQDTLEERVKERTLELEESNRALLDAQGERWKLASAVEQSPNAVAITDTEGVIEYVNPRFVDITGYSSQEAIGSSDLLGGGAAESSRLRETMVHGSEWHGEYQTRRKDGLPYWASLSFSPLRRNKTEDSAGSISHWIAIEVDITDRKIAENSLRESEARYRALTYSAPDAIVSADETGSIVSWNKSAEDIFGYSEEEAIGQELTMLMPERFRGAHKLSLAKTDPMSTRDLAGGPLELVGLRSNGTEFPLELRLGTWHTEAGNFYTGIIRDVSAKKDLDAQLLQSQKMEAVGQLAGGVAHDFNNLITGILGFCQLALQQTPPDDKVAIFLREAQASAERAARLTSQLLSFSRSRPTEIKVVNIDELIGNLSSLLRRLIGENIQLEINLGSDGIVELDPSQFEQVLVNLAVNARDAMPCGGELYISTEFIANATEYPDIPMGMNQQDRLVLATIRDTGTGMSDEILARVFEPFFTTKEDGKGTGLGLATCYGIIERNGGQIKVSSKEGEGTAFKIYLPASSKEVDPESKNVESQQFVGTEKILVVEDEPMVRNLVASTLTSAGYQIMEASDGKEAWQWLEQNAKRLPDLLLTDVVMPNMGGLELAQKVKGSYPDIRILLTSGYTGDERKQEEIMGLGMDFIAKPFDIESMKAKVREVLERYPTASTFEVAEDDACRKLT